MVSLMKNYPLLPRIFHVSITLIAIGSAVVLASVWTPKSSKPPSGSYVSLAAVQAPTAQDSTLPSGEMEMIRLSSKGFEPAAISRRRGKFLLAVINRTSLPALSLRLVHENRRLVVTRRLGREMSWRHVLDLQPGQYSLRETNHPDWICRITIEPR